ncbi:MAG: serine hydrolase domain-containing protein [Planctomycetota bacterium]
MRAFNILFAAFLFVLFLGAPARGDESWNQGNLREGNQNRLRTKIAQPEIPIATPLSPPIALTEGELEDYITDQMAAKHIPGLSATIVKEDKIIWTGAFGVANFDHHLAVQESTLFMLASVTKTVTATALMQLWEQDLFELHDPVNNYLPFAVIHPFHPDEDITFHMLLTHTSGIRDNWNMMPYYPGDSPIPLGEYLEDYLVEGGAYYYKYQNFYQAQPGTQYHYCNIAIALAGYLVESISGVPLEPYCQDHIFAPLGMDETSYFFANLDPMHIAMPYHWNGSTYIAYGHFGYSDYPSGQLRTSAPQLTRFLATFMENLNPTEPPCSGGNPGASMGLGLMRFNGAAFGLEQTQGPPQKTQRILKSSTVQEMLKSQIPNIDPDQGLVWYKVPFGGYTHWMHNGGDQGVSTEFRYCLELDTGVVLLTNGESYFYDIISALFDYAFNQ